MATLVVKSYLEMPDLDVETRRFGIDEGKVNNGGIFKLVHGSIESIYPVLKGKKFALFWKDLDEDFVTMSTDEEMRDALSNAQDSIFKIYIRVNEDDETTGTDQHTAMNEDESPVKGNHQKADPWQVANHPIPPHPHPFQRGRGGRHHGGFFGHHPHFHGFHPHFHGHHRGHQGHHGHGHSHWGKHHGRDGKQEWKDALRNSVPMPHRRWAKGFIQSWRKDNLKNATTTDSDCNSDGKTTIANAGVPPTYEEWLKLKLVHWHSKWCSEEMNVETANKKDIKKMKKTLKATVPAEFRKWTKWYLNSHFCIRESPKFKRGFRDREHNWKNKASMKKHFLSAEVPKEYRAWTKQFVRDWRIEKKLDDPNSAISPSSDSEGFERDKDLPGEESILSIPEAYKQWLEIFLLRWHTWRSQLERNPGQSLRGGMHQFQDTVPMEFRAWVKHYLCTHYSKNKGSDRDPFQGQYQKILQTFQKKWIHVYNAQNLDEESSSQSSSSCSEDEISAKNFENETGEPEDSFCRLSLKNEGHAPQKSKEQAKSDFPMTFGFRHWAKQALAEWDGQTVIDVNDSQQKGKGGEDVPLSPHVYRWMSKFMMRMHKKKMKHMFKATKREMKAAKKLRKSE